MLVRLLKKLFTPNCQNTSKKKTHQNQQFIMQFPTVWIAALAACIINAAAQSFSGLPTCAVSKRHIPRNPRAEEMADSMHLSLP